MNVIVLAPTETDTVLGQRYTIGIQYFSTDLLWHCSGAPIIGCFGLFQLVFRMFFDGKSDFRL